MYLYKKIPAFVAALCLMISGVTSVSNAQTVFEAHLSGSNEVSPITTEASGNITATLDGNELVVEGSFDNLSGEYAAAHIHSAMAGSNGSVEIALTADVNSDTDGGTFVAADNTFTLTAEQVSTLEARGFYVNVHSSVYGSGEIRGQVVPESDAQFRANLSGAFETHSAKTRAHGSVVMELRGDSLFVSGSFADLKGEFNSDIQGGSHLHIGPAGSDGNIAINLNANVESDNKSGVYLASDNAFELTAEQKSALMNREVYVNIHTTEYAAGELRGQAVSAASAAFYAQLTGSAEIPSVNTPGMGAAVVEVKGDTLVLTGSFAQLESNFDLSVGSHLHAGHSGENGSVAIALDADASAELNAGVYAAEENTFVLTSDQKDALFDREFYVNVHTAANAAGAIRGQVLGEARAYFHTNLSGIHEVEPVKTDGWGAVTLELKDSTVIVSGGFADLSSTFNTDVQGGAHIHSGAVSANGGIEMDLDATVGANDTSGVFKASNNTFVFTEAQVNTLMEGNTYVNIHSETHASGELRGQLLSMYDMFPTKVEITAPESEAELMIEGESTSMFEAEWTEASDTNDITYVWQLSTDAAFENIVVNANVEAETNFQATFGMLDTLLADLGVEVGGSAVVYHRVIASNGSNESTSNSRPATMQRGTVTSNEEAGTQTPHKFSLSQNYPNPFNPTTDITFTLSEASEANITVYNMLGQKVAVLANERFSAGEHSVKFDAKGLSSGIYIYRLQAEGKSVTKQMTLIK